MGTSRVTFMADRMPVLEELFEPAVLKTEEMNAEAVGELKGYIPPVLRSQMEASLTAEFGQPILATDWGQYQDPMSSLEQAARLIHHTLAIYSNLGRTRKWSQREKPTDRAALNEAWIKEECQRLWVEIQAGDYSRWLSVESMVGPEWMAKLTAAQLAVVKPAVAILATNASIHPRTKGEIIGEICKTVHQSL